MAMNAAASILLVALCRVAAAQDAPVYRNPGAPVDARVKDLVGRMNMDEKFW